jgi:phosphatidylglycerophosphate synthase
VDRVLLYLTSADDARAALLPVLGRPVAFRAVVTALRAGARQVGVPLVFRGTAVEHAIASSPSVRTAVVWVSPGDPPWVEPALLHPAAALASVEAVARTLAAGPRPAQRSGPGTGWSHDHPMVAVDPGTIGSLWPGIAAGDPLVPGDPHAPGGPGVPATSDERSCVPVTSAAAVREAETLLYRSLGSAADSWFDVQVHRRLSRPLSRMAVARGVKPNHVSLASLAVGVGAAWCLARATPTSAALGVLLYFLAVVLDHADGEVARLSLAESRVGEVLDVLVDTTVGALVVLAIGVSAAATGFAPGIALGLVGSAGVAASTFAIKRWPPVAAPSRAGGPVRAVVDALGDRLVFYLTLLGAVLLLALAPAGLGILVAVIGVGTHAYWIARAVVSIRTARRKAPAAGPAPAGPASPRG